MQRTRTFYKGMSKRKKDQDKQGYQKVQIKQMAEVTEERWLNSWPSSVTDGVDDKIDVIAAYQMMNGVCEAENHNKTLNIYRGMSRNQMLAPK